MGGTAEQVPQQLRGIGTGALFGTAAAATAVTLGAAAAIPTGGLSMAAAGAAAKTAFGWGMRAGYAVDMWEDSAAQRYIEYSRFKDKDGKRAFVLTLQAREQHIRREKAASNICSNEALCALNAVIYLTLLGPKGLQEVAELNLERAHQLAEKISTVKGYSANTSVPFFNEFVVTCPVPASQVIESLENKGIAAGYDLGENKLLVCATELRTPQDLQAYVGALGGI